ncbi:serine hydrolase domain-containing protein [Tateyamaria pelophila]|uniref:serine hydrolase domain-containing protein n=1 Tax=Tateyamaria pelophila TaxID=328415 RepID=UPI001CBFDE08|nr:serine hydrolase domain-containing protein [Tateyamaria pelophila]
MQAFVRTVVILMWLPMVATAQDSDRMSAMRAAYAEWLVRNEITGTGALAYQETPVTAIGDATAPIELASVSKSITALCAAALSDAGQLDFSHAVRDLLGKGPDVSVGSLVTHTSGIVADITQPLMVLWLNSDDHRADIVLNLMKDPVGVPGAYAYNNVNYALLALVIEASTGADYESTCRRLVLDPAGARGQASERSGGFLSWGGWAMSPFDYARVHGYWYGPGTNTGRNPFDYPHVALDDAGVFYGLGTAFRASHIGDGIYDFWHFGALCFSGLFNVGAYAVTWAGGWTVVLGYDGCVDRAARRDLDEMMRRAAQGPFE